VDPHSDEWAPFFATLLPGEFTHAHWPHFTLRPSLMRTDAMQAVGRFDDRVEDFELEFAHRYQRHGWHTAFFDEVHFLHIGKLTTDPVGSGAAPSAYDLTGRIRTRRQESQDHPGASERTPIWVINLDRRPNRWQMFTDGVLAATDWEFLNRCRRVSAVDGTILQSTVTLERLFLGNDFGSRRGVIGCALSHLELWSDVADGDHGWQVIFEDDTSLVDHFDRRLDIVEDELADRYNEVDIVFLGYLPWQQYHAEMVSDVEEGSALVPMRWERYLGGLGSYVLTRRGARRLLELVERDGVTNGIDWFVLRHASELVGLECSPPLTSAEHAMPGSEVDSDIQYDFEPIAPRATAIGPSGLTPPSGSLAALAPSFVMGEIVLDVDPAWECAGASIAGNDHEFRMIVRTVPPGASAPPVEYIDYVVWLDPGLQVRAVTQLTAGDGVDLKAGYDALRLCVVDGTWWATAQMRAHGDRESGSIVFAIETATITSVGRLPVLEHGGGSPAPFADRGALGIVRSWSPVVVSWMGPDGAVYDEATATVSQGARPGGTSLGGGSSGGVAIDDGLLFLAYDAVANDGMGRRHRFILMDHDHQVRSMSPSFELVGGADEECGGMALDGGSLVLSLRKDGRSSVLAKVALDEVLRLLEPTD
jgi:GR25 family glycosyltransferase involved in LPS biosynthesis